MNVDPLVGVVVGIGLFLLTEGTRWRGPLMAVSALVLVLKVIAVVVGP